MGVVYEALDKSRNHRVALKTLTRAEPSAIYRLKNEFRALADVVHPHLVGLHELFVEDDRWFFTMDFIDGIPFIQHARASDDSWGPTITIPPEKTVGLPSQGGAVSPSAERTVGRLDPVVLRETMLQLVDGVRAIHDARKLHRDLKPSNVLVTRDGRVKILDFGLVSGADFGDIGKTVSGELAGTPGYMSPEQARREPATVESDWYSVGVILYEALTGRLPFGGHVLDVLAAKQERMPVRPREVDASLPEDLDELCVDLLQIAPQRRPKGSEVLVRLGAATSSTARSTPGDGTARAISHQGAGAPPFVGRRGEIEQLSSALGDADRGKPVLMRMHGLSGIGKSALLRHFIDTVAREHGAVVLESRCYERESVPYKGIDGIVDALTRHMRRLPPIEAARLVPRHVDALARLFPVLQRVQAVASTPHRRGLPPDPAELRRKAFSALGDLLGRMANESPLVLCIDDFQWADLDSVNVLRDLFTQPEPAPCLIVVAYRSEESEHSEALRSLEAILSESTFDVRELSVSGLTQLEVSELGRSLAPSLRALNTNLLWQESQGNPYFVHELVQQISDPEEDTPPPSSRLSLEHALRARIGELQEEPRRLLELVAVLGRPTPAKVLSTALDLGDETGSLRLLRAKHFIRMSSGGFVEAYHDRVRVSVVETLSSDDVRSLHARIAPVLEAIRTEPQVLVEHYRAAGNDDRAFLHAIPAAERAAEALAFDHAARFYRLALEILPSERAREAGGLQWKLAEILANAGRPMEAAAAYERAAETMQGGDAARLRTLAAAQKLLAGHVGQGISDLKALLLDNGVEIPSDPLEQFQEGERARKEWEPLAEHLVREGGWRTEGDLAVEERTQLDLLHAAHLGLFGYDQSLLSHVVGNRHGVAACVAREPMRCLRASTALLYGQRSLGMQPRRHNLDIMRAAGEKLDSPLARAWQKFDEGVAAHFAMDGPLAVHAFSEAEQIFSTRCHGVTRELSFVRFHIAANLLLTGRIRDRLNACDEWLRVARERGDFFLELWMTILGCKHLCADDPEAMRREIELMLAQLESLSGVDPSQSVVGVVQMIATYALCQLDCYGDGRDKAWSRLESFRERWESEMLIAAVPLHRLLLQLHQALALAALSGSAAWRTDLELRTVSLAKQLTTSDRPLMAMLGRVLRATLARLRGDREGAITELGAAALHVETWSPIWSHCTRRQVGKLVGGTEGMELIGAADEVLRAEGVANPERWANMWVPGFSSVASAR